MFSKLSQKVISKRINYRSYSKSKYNPHDLQGRVGIVGVPFGKGQKKKGKEEAGLKIAPDLLRSTGFIKTLECIGLEVVDYGNVQYNQNCDLAMHDMYYLEHVAPCCQAVASSVQSTLDACRSCLVLGGDHSIAIGSIYAHMTVAGVNNVALVYVDAHADINTNKTSPSGNIHGMTVAVLAKEMQDHWEEGCLPGMDWLLPCFPMKNLAYIGLRAVDSGEAKFLLDSHATVYSMEEVEKNGITKVLGRSLSQIDPSGNKSIHLSFDIDALDSFEAPCTTLPVRAGLTLREGIAIAETLQRTGRLAVVDLVEVSPTLGSEAQKQITLEAARNIIIAAFGYLRHGNIKS